MRSLRVGVAVVALACTGRFVTTRTRLGDERGAAGVPDARDASERLIRVALATTAQGARLSGTGEWRLYASDGRAVLARAAAGESWRLESEGTRLRGVRPDGVPTMWDDGPLVARPVDARETLSFGGRRYRGELTIHTADRGLVVVNQLRIDDYLKGVVPLELGTRAAGDSAALQAQAVAARSYAFIHLDGDRLRPFDLTADVRDQVYGGLDAETAVGSRAVESTSGLVLRYAGHVVNAPYSSTCGGTTAEASEIWRTRGEPYLRRVSDAIPGTDRYFCDISPRFRWSKTFDAVTLNAAIARYLSTYATVPNGGPGVVRSLAVDVRTPSGRVGILAIGTDRGNFVVRGNDTRFVLRAPGGEMLNSTYFSIETATAPDGTLSAVTLHGTGYGHGVGMCQWGAIGRARAGQDFRTILQTYYPGTSLGTVN